MLGDFLKRGCNRIIVNKYLVMAKIRPRLYMFS